MPAAGILDVLDNYAFVRTSGYLAGADDVYLSLSMVRKFALRRGDAIVGQVRQPREGERKEKFNPMVRVDSVNGADPESAKSRVEFTHLTPVHPQQRLRLETGPDNLIGRVIDIVTPVGKGQRGLIVAPAQAGKSTILQSVATSITTNNPECHLMVVLVDERPEEVTDFERAVKGEVIASTFDRPRPTTPPSPSSPSSGPSGWSSSATTWSCWSTGCPDSAAPTTSPARRPGGPSPAASTPRRSRPPRSSSAPPAAWRTVARSPSLRPPWWTAARPSTSC